MKNTKTKYFVNNSLIGMVMLMLLFAAACSSLTGGFSRGTAAKAIQEDKRYGAPILMTIDIGGRIANASADTPQKSVNETVEEAAVRVREDFMQKQPQLLLAEQLGYIKLHFEDGELGDRRMGAPRFDDSLRHWYFKAKAEITDRGKSLWKDLNLSVDEQSLPLAVRGTPDVTGMKDENQNMKSVDFAYKWEPNELGRAFDSSSDQFKQLPQNLQEALKKNQYNPFGSGGNNIIDFKTSRTGKAYFQKFDDGWRLSNLAFL
jgi:hypothetical protein